MGSDPEPCDDCDTGIQKFVCFDGVRRCHNCVTEFAVKNGWDEMPPPPEPALVPASPGPTPLSPMERKALREEKKEIARRQGTIL